MVGVGIRSLGRRCRLLSLMTLVVVTGVIVGGMVRRPMLAGVILSPLLGVVVGHVARRWLSCR